MTTYKARAVRWEHGWELHVEGVGVTQVRTLDKAADQVLDLVATMLDDDAIRGATVIVMPELGGVERKIARAQKKTQDAAQLQLEAAAETRHAARELREHGLSVTDIAAVMHVSRGRVSQLLEGGTIVAKDAKVGSRSIRAKDAKVRSGTTVSRDAKASASKAGRSRTSSR